MSKGQFSRSRIQFRELTCIECGQVFASRFGRRRTCSPKCAAAVLNRGLARLDLAQEHGVKIPLNVEAPLEDGHTQLEWLNLLEQYGWRCFYCGSELNAWNATKDHQQPISRGGSDRIENIVPSCRACNCKKGNRWPWPSR